MALWLMRFKQRSMGYMKKNKDGTIEGKLAQKYTPKDVKRILRGGRREGAGRPSEGRERVTIYVKREILARWKEIKGHFPLGEFLEKILGNIKKKDEK